MIFGSILKKIPVKHGRELGYLQRVKSANEGHEVIVPDFEILDVNDNEIHVKQDYVRGDTLKSYKCYSEWEIHELIFLDCVLGYGKFGITDYGWNNFIYGVDKKLYYIDLGGFRPSDVKFRAKEFERKYIDAEYNSCLRRFLRMYRDLKINSKHMEAMRKWCLSEYQK